MAQIYSTLFDRLTFHGAGPAVIFTVPAGYVAVLRELQALNGSGGVGALSLGEGVSGLDTLAFTGVAAGASVLYQGRMVYLAGQEIRVTANAAGWNVAAAGYLLTA